MKPYIRLLLLAGIVFSVAGQAPFVSADQLLENPSFELPATGEGQPDSWTSLQGERIVDKVYYTDVEPPTATYPDGRQVVRAYVVSWGEVKPQGWCQTVKVVPGATYKLSGYLWTSMGDKPIGYRYPIGRIGVDLDGASTDMETADIWCAPKGNADNTEGWYQSVSQWTRLSAVFKARTSQVTVYAIGKTFSTYTWMAVHFDNITLVGPPPGTRQTASRTRPKATLIPTPQPEEESNAFGQWTQLTKQAPWPARFGFAAVVFRDKIWIFGGTNNMNSMNDIWSSPDGVNWTEVASNAPWSPRRYHAVVNYHNKLWLYGGRAEGRECNEIWSSEDGEHWKLVKEHAEWSPRFAQETLIHQGKLWILGGTTEHWENTPGLNDVWCSTNGRDWSLVRDDAAWYGRDQYAAASFKGRLWVLGGVGASDVWSSRDGAAWRLEDRNAVWEGRSGHRALVIDNKLHIFFGYPYQPGILTDIWATSDGARWSQVTTGEGWPGRANFQCLLFKNRVYILGGAKGRFETEALYNDVWCSDELAQGKAGNR